MASSSTPRGKSVDPLPGVKSGRGSEVAVVEPARTAPAHALTMNRAARWVFRLVLCGVPIVALSILLTASVSPPAPSLEAKQALQALRGASFDWTQHVETESGENSDIAGEPVYSDVSHLDKMWLLRQRVARSNVWKRYGMAVINGHAYFATMDGKPKLLGAECAACHPNGPRALRGTLRAGTEAGRLAINTFIEDIGLVRPHLTENQLVRVAKLGKEPRFPNAECARCHPRSENTLWGEMLAGSQIGLIAINESVRLIGLPPPFTYPAHAEPPTHRLQLAPCLRCHNGERRTWLTIFNRRAIAYQLSHQYMPPDSDATPDERRRMTEWLQAGS
jgi:hypothetical protein